MKHPFAEEFRKSFFRGLTVVVPTILTVAIIVWVIDKIHTYIGKYINVAAVHIISWLGKLSISPEDYDTPEDYATLLRENLNNLNIFWGRWLWWVGLLLAVVAVYILGRFVASFFGRFVWRFTEKGLSRLPIIKAVYPYVKQVTDFMFSEHRMDFSRVVAVEYPRKGSWSLALVTAPGMRTLTNALGSDLLTVFIPSSPTPITGYTLTVRRDEVVDLPITIDEAIKFAVSGGVIMPSAEQLTPQEIHQARQGMFLASPQPQEKETSA